jgi:hypothetical protein
MTSPLDATIRLMLRDLKIEIAAVKFQWSVDSGEWASACEQERNRP